MKSLTRLAVLVILLSLVLPIGVASSEQAPVAQSTIFRSKFETVAPAAPFDLLLTVSELQPAAWNPPHNHSATAYITVLEGEWTNIRIVDGQKMEPEIYRPGDTIVGPAWSVHEAGNLGATRTRILITRLQPKGAPATINLPIESYLPGAPPPTQPYQASTEIANVSGPLDLYQTWSEWSPGARLPPHFHPGVELGIVLEGELTFTKATATTVGAGESQASAVGEIHAVANATADKASSVTAHLIASGQPFNFVAE